MSTKEKYLVFSPYRSGLGNVIMSYECALALSYITNRKLLLAPTLHITHICVNAKETGHTFWDLFDESITRQEFDIEDYHSHELFQGKFEQMQTYYSWFENLPSIVEDCYSWKPGLGEGVYHMTGSNICFVNDPTQYQDEDFRSFVCNRKVIDVNCSQQYFLFENNLFQHFWYLIYPGRSIERNKLKDKINRVVRYKQKFYDMFMSSIMNHIGAYNAVHVRRNDFFIQFGYSLQSVDQGDKLLTQLLRVFDPKKPLYIATDETDLSFFSPVREVFKDLYFIDDIGIQLSKLERAILDQIICSKADDFYGTRNSTFSKRINVMRGVEGRVVHDNTGINFLDDGDRELEEGAFPWNGIYNKEWAWNRSSYLQWTQENVS